MKNFKQINGYKKLIYLLAIIIFTASDVKAQTQILTLSSSLKYALHNKADARKAKLDIEDAQYKSG